VVRELIDFCHQYHADEIHVTRGVAEPYHRYVELLRANFVVVEYPPDELVQWSGRVPRRFMEFWRDALPRILKEAGEEDGPREVLR
jgi:hypothetical protein